MSAPPPAAEASVAVSGVGLAGALLLVALAVLVGVLVALGMRR